MPFSADVIADINASALETYIKKGKVFSQNIQNKPMLEAFDKAATSEVGGKDLAFSFAVDSGEGGGSLQGYSGDDQVSYYNPTGTKRARWLFKEHHIGITFDFTELKMDGIEVDESGADQSTMEVSGREQQALVNILDKKMARLGEDYARSKDTLLHGDGSTDPKAFAGLRSIILDSPAVGTTAGLGRVANSWWRNRAATTAYAGAGGQGPITVNPANGGALITFLETEYRQLGISAGHTPRWKMFCGSSFMDGYLMELRANGNYSMTGWQGQNNSDGGMDAPKFKGIPLVFDPTLDRLGYSKRCYWIDMAPNNGVVFKYLEGYRMKKHKPARPYDRYVMYNGITTTCAMSAYQLNTSAVYDIA